MDAHFVPNLTLGLPVVASLRKATDLPLDCHLMIDDPDRWAPGYAEAGAANVTFHVEAARDAVQTARAIRAAGALAGLSVKPGTPLEPYLEVLREFDTLLVMTVEPGFGGQRFMAEVLPKVRLAREHVQAGHLRLFIEVDGGIDADTIEAAAEAGADVFVAGSAVYGADDPGKAVAALREQPRPRWLGTTAGYDGGVSMQVSDDEQAAMHRALALAETVRGRTSPNPPVGAVILAPGRLTGRRGRHRPGRWPACRDHRAAAAGAAARGGTAVVTLEPCAHTGRTGPCADALIAAGVAKVIYAVDDLNPVAAGGATRAARGRRPRHRRRRGDRGVRRRAAAVAARGAHRPPVRHLEVRGLPRRPRRRRRLQRPMDLLDHVARRRARLPRDRGRDRRRQRHRAGRRPAAHRPRRRRQARRHQPLRVVLDRRHRAPQSARVFDNAAETLVLDTAVPRFALKALYDRGIRHVLLEGGPTLAGAFIEARLVDEVIAYLAPKLLGEGPSALGHAGIASIDEAVTLDVDTVTQAGRRRQDRRAPGLAGRGVAPVFTGIIEEIGEVVGLERNGDSAVLTLAAHTILADVRHGASIAVNGVCLTVIGWTDDGPIGTVAFDVMGETLKRSVIGGLRPATG